MLVVGPSVAADSEPNLHPCRLSGAPRAASVGSLVTRDLAAVGALVATVSFGSVRVAGVVSDNLAPPGRRHRRFASERA